MKDRIVKTESGYIQGCHGWDPRILTFKGIPYAAPPVGSLRWKAPQPPQPWEGIRRADEYGPVALQPLPGSDPDDFYAREIHPTGPEFRVSEDCLYLNVFTPARSEEEKLPVLFYIHGGGYRAGYPYEVEFDWEHVARKGMVVVAVAYRLGVMGFLAHPELSAEDPAAPKGNFGLQDQLAALRWTKRNIQAFGGDPDRITIAGQSAGAGSVQSLLISPQVEEGLIAGAIMESGIFLGLGDLFSPMDPLDLETAHRRGETLFALAGAGSLEEARALPAEELLRIESAQMGPGIHFQPVCDGIFLTQTPLAAYKAGQYQNVPVLAGYNRGETRGFMRRIAQFPENMAEYEAFAKRYGEMEAEFRTLVPVSSDEDVTALFDRDAFSDLIAGTWLFGLLQSGHGRKAYLYEFDPDIPGDDDAGSYHGCEMWFAYDSLARCWRPFEGRHYDLARQVSGYWANFVKSGDPNGADAFGYPLPQWDAYSADKPFLLGFRDVPYGMTREADAVMEFRTRFARR